MKPKETETMNDISQSEVQHQRKELCSYLHRVATSRNITHAQIANKTGHLQQNVSRMLAAKNSPSLDNFLKLCDAVGVHVFVIDKEKVSLDFAKTLHSYSSQSGNKQTD